MSQLVCNLRKYLVITTVFSSVAKGGGGGGRSMIDTGHGLKLDEVGQT